MSEHDIRPSASYHELIDALRFGCPVCVVVGRRIQRWIDTLLYEHVNDGPIRVRLRRSLGFCNRHAWLVRAAGDALGQVTIYEDILTVAAQQLQGGRLPLPGSECILCQEEAAVRRAAIDEFVRHLHDDELQARYRESTGLCLVHLGDALAHADDAALRTELLQVEYQKVVGIVGDLAELKRRQDWRLAGRPPGRERDAWDRAIEKLRGRPGTSSGNEGVASR